MSLNLLNRVRGSASLHFKGQDFWTKDVAALGIDLKPFKVKSDAQGVISQRFGGRLVSVTFTPVGTWTAAQLAVLYPWLNARIGDFNTPIRTITAVTTGAGTSTIVSNGHGQITGTGIRFCTQPGVTLPPGLAVNTTYFINANNDGNTITLYDTEAHALAGGATGQIALTGAGSVGTVNPSFIVNTPLTITTVDGVQLVIWNAAVTKMPALGLTSVDTAFKQVTIEGYTLHGLNWSDANSLLTLTTGVIGATAPAQSQIPTVAYTVDWATRLVVPAANVNTGTNAITITGHGLTTTQAVTVDDLGSADALPSGLALNTTYYVIAVDANTIKLATTSGNATAGTAIALVTAGSGDWNVVSLIQAEGLQPREAIEVEPDVTWADVMVDSDGLSCRSITDLMVKASFVPTNLAAATIQNALNFQGAGAGRGNNLPTANLDIYGPADDPFIRIYAAQLLNDPLKFGAQADRVDKLSFEGLGIYRTGSQKTIAYIGATEPAN